VQIAAGFFQITRKSSWCTTARFPPGLPGSSRAAASPPPARRHNGLKGHLAAPRTHDYWPCAKKLGVGSLAGWKAPTYVLQRPPRGRARSIGIERSRPFKPHGLSADIQSAMQKLPHEIKAGRQKSRNRRKSPKESGFRSSLKSLFGTMNLKCGIAGLPNSAVDPLQCPHQRQARADNYPFCTIEPNTLASCRWPDLRLGGHRRDRPAAEVVPAWSKFVDIAGLVAGASRGEGLGNQSSPTSARPTPSRTNKVRCFDDPNVDPRRGQGRSGVGHRDHQHRLALADLEAVEGSSPVREGGADWRRQERRNASFPP